MSLASRWLTRHIVGVFWIGLILVIACVVLGGGFLIADGPWDRLEDSLEDLPYEGAGFVLVDVERSGASVCFGCDSPKVAVQLDTDRIPAEADACDMLQAMVEEWLGAPLTWNVPAPASRRLCNYNALGVDDHGLWRVVAVVHTPEYAAEVGYDAFVELRDEARRD